MSDEKHSKAFREKNLPEIHKKINSAYISCIEIKNEEIELEKLKEQYSIKKTEANKRIKNLKKKCKQIEKRKQEESMGISSVIEQTEKKIEKIQLQNNQFKNLQIQMEELITSTEEKVELVEQMKNFYSQLLEFYKPCKDLITAVTKICPTVITAFELGKRLESLITNKERFSDEYQEYYNLHESERKKLLYANALGGNLNMIVLSNKLDELEQERKDVMEAIHKEEEAFNRMMDTGSDVEAALSEIRLGCLRLFNLTKTQEKTYDSFEQLSVVQDFGMTLFSVVECLQEC